MKKIYIYVVVAVGLALFVGRAPIRTFLETVNKPQVPASVSYTNFTTTPSSTPEVTENVITNTVPPAPKPPVPQPPVPPKNTNTPEKSPASSLNLAVPFQPQAPFGDWSEPYENGCEEASIIMVDYYLRGAALSKDAMKQNIDTQVAWQEEHFGGHYDLPIVKIAEVAKAFYSYKMEVITNLTADKIRDQLRLGRPVVVPFAGRELGNPYYTQPGPLYHMMVIKGFTADGKFITNDPGTRRGADYIYSANTLMNAIHDWAGDAPDGSPIGLVMYK